MKYLSIANPSKAALKMKKNREAKKAKKELESGNSTINGQVANTVGAVKMELTDDPEKNKKIKKVKSVSVCIYVHPWGKSLIFFYYYNDL